jgi:hypothetical protein
MSNCYCHPGKAGGSLSSIRTAIYIFTNQLNLRGSAQETRTLEALSAQSGGRIFLNLGPKQIEADIETMDND